MTQHQPIKKVRKIVPERIRIEGIELTEDESTGKITKIEEVEVDTQRKIPFARGMWKERKTAILKSGYTITPEGKKILDGLKKEKKT